jgi:hypothetical protein
LFICWSIYGRLGAGGMVLRFTVDYFSLYLHVFDVKHRPFHKQITEYVHLTLHCPQDVDGDLI